jgi:hypothetical protein
MIVAVVDGVHLQFNALYTASMSIGGRSAVECFLLLKFMFIWLVFLFCKGIKFEKLLVYISYHGRCYLSNALI